MRRPRNSFTGAAVGLVLIVALMSGAADNMSEAAVRPLYRGICFTVVTGALAVALPALYTAYVATPPGLA